MISVVIPVFNEEDYIGACLDALTHQTTKRPFEVVIVNNACTDNTVSVVEKYKNTLDLKIITQTVKGRGAARNKGFQKAKGDILVSTDADVTVPADWIEQLAFNLENSGAGAVTGNCRIVEFNRFINCLLNNFQYLTVMMYRLLYGHYWLSGFNFAVYRSIYDKSGGFDVRLNAQEDVDLAFRVHKITAIKYISRLPVIVSGRRFRRGIIRGVIPYFQTFFQYYYGKNRRVVLLDIR